MLLEFSNDKVLSLVSVSGEISQVALIFGVQGKTKLIESFSDDSSSFLFEGEENFTVFDPTQTKDCDPEKLSTLMKRLDIKGGKTAVLASYVVDALDREGVLVVDDFNFHPLVAREIVKMFQSQRSAQLIATTHSVDPQIY